MQSLVKRFVRNRIVYSVFALVILACQLWLLVWVLQRNPAPTAEIGPADVQPVSCSESPQPIPKSTAAVERRKRAITRHLAAKYKQNKRDVRAYVDLAWRESAKNPAVEPELILAVIQKESSLDAKAESSYGAKGLMQVVPRWHPEKVGRYESLLDPKVNIRVGTAILQQYIQEQGHIGKALVKYSGNAYGYADFVLRAKAELKAI